MDGTKHLPKTNHCTLGSTIGCGSQTIRSGVWKTKGNALSLLLRGVICCVRRKEFLENSRPLLAYREWKTRDTHRGHNATVSAQSMLNAHAHLDPGCHMGGKAHVPVTGHIHQSTDNTSVHYCLEGNQASLTSSSSFSRVLSDICRFFSTPPATTQNAVFRELSGPL